MKIKEVLDLLHTAGNTLNSVAKTVGIGEKRLKQALNNAGFSYDQRSKAYVFSDIGRDYNPEDDDIEKYVTPVKDKRANSNTRVIQKGEEKVQEKRYIVFSDDEMIVLKKYAQELLEEQKYQTEKGILHKRVRELEKKDRGRKTFAIAPALEERFVAFCAENRLQQADVLEIALEDLLRRYK